MTLVKDSHQTIFATTRWTLVCDAAGGGDASAMEAMGQLCEAYWQPLYRYVRRIGRTTEDAEDLVQGFFAQLLEQGGLRLADRGRGRFRAFLIGSLKHFMANEWQREHRQKRGGFSAHLSIDWVSAESGLSLEIEDMRSPDRLYDREWALAVLDKVLDDLAREEKGFAQWKPFLSLRSDRISYAAIAAEFGMTESAVRVAVHRLRKRYRQRLQLEISRTLSDASMVEDEMKVLFAALSQS